MGLGQLQRSTTTGLKRYKSLDDAFATYEALDGALHGVGGDIDEEIPQGAVSTRRGSTPNLTLWTLCVSVCLCVCVCVCV